MDRDESMGTILMQGAFLSAVTEGGVDPAFHPSGVGKMGTVHSHGIVVVNHVGTDKGPSWPRSMGGRRSFHPNTQQQQDAAESVYILKEGQNFLQH